MSLVCECQDTFIFEGSKPECVQGRFLNTRLNIQANTLVVNEYVLSEAKKGGLNSSNLIIKQVFCLQLSDEFKAESVIGSVICIGCVGDLLIFQYVSSEKHAKYIRFLVGDTNSMKMSQFDDTHHFFNRDSAAVAPLECLLSPDKTVCLLRLPQSILSPKKWSKLLMCKKSDETAPIGLSNAITGTRQSQFRDRKFQLIAFDPLQSSRLVMILLDSYCSKCKISVHDFKLDKEILQCKRKLMQQTQKRYDTDSDSDDEELVYYFLQDCSLAYSRSGENFLITCLLTDSTGGTYCHIYFFSSETFNLVGFHTFDKEMFPMKKCERLVPVFSACDSQVMFLLVEKQSDQYVELFQCSVPKPINLKSFCRSVIIRNMKSDRSTYLGLPLPPSLITYLQFIICKGD